MNDDKKLEVQPLTAEEIVKLRGVYPLSGGVMAESFTPSEDDLKRAALDCCVQGLGRLNNGPCYPGTYEGVRKIEEEIREVYKKHLKELL